VLLLSLFYCYIVWHANSETVLPFETFRQPIPSTVTQIHTVDFLCGLTLFMMTTNLFVIANVKQLRTDGSFRILLHLFRIYWVVGVLNSAIFNNFHNRVEFGMIFRAFLISGGLNNPTSRRPPPTFGRPLY